MILFSRSMVVAIGLLIKPDLLIVFILFTPLLITMVLNS